MAPKPKGRFFSGTRVLWFFAMACASEPKECPTASQDGTCGGLMFETHQCVGLGLSPKVGDLKSRILKGDQIKLATSSDSGFAAPVSWSISTDAVDSIAGTTVSLPGYPIAELTVRAAHAGSATITATHTNPLRTASTTITVADSSEITKIDLFAPASVKVGTSGYMSVNLKNAAGQVFMGLPNVWTMSDSSIVLIRMSGNGSGFIDGVKVGTTSVTAAFLGVSATFQVTVVP